MISTEIFFAIGAVAIVIHMVKQSCQLSCDGFGRALTAGLDKIK